MERTRQVALPLRPPGLLTTAVAGLTALATILSFLLEFDPVVEHPVPAVAVVLTITAWLVGWLAVRQRRYLPLNLVKGGPPHGIELDEDDRPYYTTIAVTCPDCGEQMGLHARSGDNQPILICRRARKLHQLLFDHTQLPSLLPKRRSRRRRSRNEHGPGSPGP